MIRKILVIEDTMTKYCAINRALQHNGYPAASLAKNAETGISKIEEAIAGGSPYNVLITDMHFSVNGKDDFYAGEYVIDELQRRKIEIPVIICSSSGRYRMPGVIGSILYNENTDLEWELKELLYKVK